MSQPKPVDPLASSNQQLGFNTQAAGTQQRMNMIGQNTPLGSLAWQIDPNAPGGYSADVSLTPAQQGLLNLRQAAQTGVGTAAEGLGGQMAGLFGTAPNLDTTTMTNQLMDWQTQSMQPYWDIQKSNLEAQLQNQGLTPNDPAWQNSMMAFTKGIGQARNQMFAQAEPLAFSQGVTKYQLPMQTEASLLGMSGPQSPSFVSTPQEQIQSPNYQQAAQNQYLAQQQQYQNMMQGVGQLGGMALGGLMGNPGLFGVPLQFAGGWGGGGGGSAPTVLGGSF
jgi:hypothetical protein